MTFLLIRYKVDEEMLQAKDMPIFAIPLSLSFLSTANDFHHNKTGSRNESDDSPEKNAQCITCDGRSTKDTTGAFGFFFIHGYRRRRCLIILRRLVVFRRILLRRILLRSRREAQGCGRRRRGIFLLSGKRAFR